MFKNPRHRCHTCHPLEKRNRRFPIKKPPFSSSENGGLYFEVCFIALSY